MHMCFENDRMKTARINRETLTSHRTHCYGAILNKDAIKSTRVKVPQMGRPSPTKVSTDGESLDVVSLITTQEPQP